MLLDKNDQVKDKEQINVKHMARFICQISYHTSAKTQIHITFKLRTFDVDQ